MSNKPGVVLEDDFLFELAVANQIPRELHQSLVRYFEDCIETGGFLRSVLENDLLEAVNRSRYSQPHSVLYALIEFLQAWAPSNAWGNKEAVADWLARPKGEI